MDYCNICRISYLCALYTCCCNNKEVYLTMITATMLGIILLATRNFVAFYSVVSTLLSICACFSSVSKALTWSWSKIVVFYFHYFTASGGRLPSILRTNQTPRLYIRLLNLPRTEKITCSLLPSTLITSSLYMQPLGCFRQLVGRAFLRGRLGVTLPSEEQWLLFLKLLLLWCSHHFYYLQYNSWNMDLAMLDPSLICQTLVSYARP